MAGSGNLRLHQGHNAIHKRRPSRLQEEEAAVDLSADGAAAAGPLSKRAKASSSDYSVGLDATSCASQGARLYGETEEASSGSVHSTVGKMPLSGLRQLVEPSARVVSTAAASSCDEESRTPVAARHEYFMDDFLKRHPCTQTGRRSYTIDLGTGKYTITVHVPPPQGKVTCRVCPEGEIPDYTTAELRAHIKSVHASKWTDGMSCPWRGANGGQITDVFNKGFAKHLQTHMEPYTCEHCPRACKAKARLDSHVTRMHGLGADVSGAT